ncbi:MAG: helix-turn-helix domain-containing protein [Gordonia amarae]
MYTALDAPDVTWLTTTQAAQASGIPVSTLHWWAQSGTSPVTVKKLGGRWLWLRSSLSEALAA